MKSETNRRGADHPGRQTGPSRKDTKRGGWSQEEKPRQRPARPATAEDVRAGDDIVVTVKRIGINGEGVGYYKRKAVFVDGVLPGEVVKAKVAKVEPGYLQAAAIKIEKKSPERQEPPCPVYASCGGCQLQHMTYEAQLRAKEEIVREAFQRYAGIDRLPLRPILGMDDPWGYRNKAQLQAGRGESGLVAGLYSLGTRQLVDISGCAVHDPRLNEAVERTKRVLEELDLPVYEEKKRQGIVKTIAVRVSRRTGKLQLTLVTAGDRFPDARRFVQAVRRELPQVGSISHNIHKGGSPLVFGDKTVHLWGEDKLEETLGGLRFSLSPRAFFQLNPEQTVKLYGAVQEAAALSGGELVVDAYCGKRPLLRGTGGGAAAGVGAPRRAPGCRRRRPSAHRLRPRAAGRRADRPAAAARLCELQSGHARQGRQGAARRRLPPRVGSAGGHVPADEPCGVLRPLFQEIAARAYDRMRLGSDLSIAARD